MVLTCLWLLIQPTDDAIQHLTQLMTLTQPSQPSGDFVTTALEIEHRQTGFRFTLVDTYHDPSGEIGMIETHHFLCKDLKSLRLIESQQDMAHLVLIYSPEVTSSTFEVTGTTGDAMGKVRAQQTGPYSRADAQAVIAAFKQLGCLQ